MKEFNINNCPEKHYYVEFLVFKNFIAALKKRGMYNNFRATVGTNTNNSISILYKKMNSFANIIQHQSKENIFRDAKDIGTFLKMMVTYFNGKCGSDFNEGDNMKLQRHITNCINMLLHIFVERYNRDFQLLSEIGGDIYNETCNEIFGENFVDLTAPSPEEQERINEINRLMSMNTGKLPQISPEMMDKLRNFIESNRNIYGEEPIENPFGWVDEDDYEFNDEEEFLDEEFEDNDDIEENPF